MNLVDRKKFFVNLKTMEKMSDHNIFLLEIASMQLEGLLSG
jgi:hypothetical protein